jgi:S1-C subfamily serine protease
MHMRSTAPLAAGIAGASLAAAAFVFAFRPASLQADAKPRTDVAAIATLEDIGKVFERVALHSSPAVVSIDSRHRGEDGRVKSEDFGSGVLIRPKEGGKVVVVTNLHVLGKAAAAEIDVMLSDGRVFHPTSIWRDYDTDLALLESPFSDLPAAKLADSDEARVGQWVLVLGSPFGLTQSVTHGIISARNRRQIGMPGSIRIKEFLQTDAPINPGNSGGPLVNLKGEVIGINTAIASYTGKNSGVGFSIPSNLVKWVASELVTHGEVRRAFLGVIFPPSYDNDKAVALGLPMLRGALVDSVHPASPAAEAGLKRNDIILEFAGQPVEDENHLINTVALTPIGRKVEMLIWRDRAKKTVATILGQWSVAKEPSALRLEEEKP